MAFDVFPDPNTAATLGKPPFKPISLAAGETMRAFVKLPQHVGPDPTQPGVRATFVRIALWRKPPAPALTPGVEIVAMDPTSSGFSPRVVDPAVSYSIATGVQLFDSVNSTSAAIAYFAPPAANNVHLLKAVIEITNTSLWLRLSNPNEVSCYFVWVVADNDEDAKQPWLNVRTPYDAGAAVGVEIDAYIGQAAALNAELLVIENFGSGPLTLASIDPPVPKPYVMRGAPLTVAANSLSQGEVTIGFDRPTAAGSVAAVPYRFLTRDKPDLGPFGDAHNDSILLSAQIGYNNLWTRKKPMITGRAFLAVATDVVGDIFAIGGFEMVSHNTSKKVERYNPASDQWFGSTDLPTARLALGAALGRNGWIYAIGGATTSGVTGVNEAFDPASRSWRTLAPMPTPRHDLGVAAGTDGFIYAVGGRGADGRALDLVEAYDLQADAWTTRQPLQTPRVLVGVAAGTDGLIYAAGGLNTPASPVALASLEAFDPTTAAWRYRASMPTGRFGVGFSSGRNGKLYAVGGGNQSGSSDRMEEYDPATNVWSVRANIEVARQDLGLAPISDGRLFAIGGSDPTGAVVEEFTP